MEPLSEILPIEEVKTISKNQLARDAKKLKKKVAQALAVIIKAEQRTLEEIISKEEPQT